MFQKLKEMCHFPKTPEVEANCGFPIGNLKYIKTKKSSKTTLDDF